MAGETVTFNELFGRENMGMIELLKQINSASWPESVVVTPQDYFALIPGVPPHLQRFEEDGTPYFYIAATRVRAAKPRGDVLDLRDWTPPRILPASSLIQI